jgi:hypothetical protein
MRLGLFIPLGHDGAKCCAPHLPPPAIIQVIAMSGVHAVKVLYCRCPQPLPQWKQLFRADLFPATDKRCKTAVTMDLLEAQHKLSHAAKVNLYEFYMSILRRSNPLGTAHTLVSSTSCLTGHFH